MGCEYGYFADNGSECVKCDISCKSCINKTYCNECNKDFKLNEKNHKCIVEGYNS
jgi:hypothetical protein